MTQQEKEKMFLDLNSVLVKFWIEQGRPDKEVKIELLERMLNWYKKMGYVIPDGQRKEPVSEDLEKKCATCAYFDAKTRRNGYCNAGAEKVVVVTDTICELWKPYDMGNSEKKQILKGDRLTELDKLYKQAKRELEWFKEGKRQGKEEILKDAVKGTVCKDKKCVWIELIPNALPDYEDIEPVKCVVMKED